MSAHFNVHELPPDMVNVKVNCVTFGYGDEVWVSSAMSVGEVHKFFECSTMYDILHSCALALQHVFLKTVIFYDFTSYRIVESVWHFRLA